MEQHPKHFLFRRATFTNPCLAHEYNGGVQHCKVSNFCLEIQRLVDSTDLTTENYGILDRLQDFQLEEFSYSDDIMQEEDTGMQNQLESFLASQLSLRKLSVRTPSLNTYIFFGKAILEATKMPSTVLQDVDYQLPSFDGASDEVRSMHHEIQYNANLNNLGRTHKTETDLFSSLIKLQESTVMIQKESLRYEVLRRCPHFWSIRHDEAPGIHLTGSDTANVQRPTRPTRKRKYSDEDDTHEASKPDPPGRNLSRR